MDVVMERPGVRWGEGASVSRADVVAEARTWIGTPVHHQAELKGVGADCGGLVRGVSVALGLLPADYADRMPEHFRGYAKGGLGEAGRNLCDHYWTRIAHDEMQLADVVVVSFGGAPMHMGIIVPYRYLGLAFVHADTRHGKVVETRLLFGTGPRSMQFVAAYRLPGVA